MKKPILGKVPQIVSISSVKPDGKLRLVKVAKDYLELKPGQPVYVDIDGEVLLSTKPVSKAEIPVTKGGILVLPGAVMQRLLINGPVLIGLVQRPDAVAVKVVDIEEVESDKPGLVDIETPIRILRRVETPPMPDDYIPKLQAEHAALSLKNDVKMFVKGRSTFDAWKIRQLLDCPDSADDDLQKEMITQRISAQEADGSWSGSVFSTARNLRELAELGVDKKSKEVQRAVEWIVDRSYSAYNPGMFFASDALVEEQAGVMERRKKIKSGTRPRFRQIKTSEKKNVMSGDDLIYAPCGPRIMWPNGLVLEALLAMGYEDHERVQTILETLTSQDWCECGYQNGAGAGVGRKPKTAQELDDFELSCISWYRYGGLNRIDNLKQADMAHRTFAMRKAEVTPVQSVEDEIHYTLGTANHIQGCEFITTRSLSQVRDPKALQFAEAHLWRFACIQRPEDGTFPAERYGTGFHQAGILQAVARYNHPVSKVMVLRALPWIVQNQNADGSWGEGKRKDVETYAVVYALLSLGKLLPEAIVKTL
jgi:hypothetical protein